MMTNIERKELWFRMILGSRKVVAKITYLRKIGENVECYRIESSIT